MAAWVSASAARASAADAIEPGSDGRDEPALRVAAGTTREAASMARAAAANDVESGATSRVVFRSSVASRASVAAGSEAASTASRTADPCGCAFPAPPAAPCRSPAVSRDAASTEFASMDSKGSRLMRSSCARSAAFSSGVRGRAKPGRGGAVRALAHAASAVAIRTVEAMKLAKWAGLCSAQHGGNCVPRRTARANAAALPQACENAIFRRTNRQFPASANDSGTDDTRHTARARAAYCAHRGHVQQECEG